MTSGVASEAGSLVSGASFSCGGTRPGVPSFSFVAPRKGVFFAKMLTQRSLRGGCRCWKASAARWVDGDIGSAVGPLPGRVRLQASLPGDAGDGAGDGAGAAASPASIIAAIRRAKAGASMTGSPSRIRA